MQTNAMKLSRLADYHCVTVLHNLATAGTVQCLDAIKIILLLIFSPGTDTEQTLNSSTLQKLANIITPYTYIILRMHLQYYEAQIYCIYFDIYGGISNTKFKI